MTLSRYTPHMPSCKVNILLLNGPPAEYSQSLTCECGQCIPAADVFRKNRKKQEGPQERNCRTKMPDTLMQLPGGHVVRTIFTDAHSAPSTHRITHRHKSFTCFAFIMVRGREGLYCVLCRWRKLGAGGTLALLDFQKHKQAYLPSPS